MPRRRACPGFSRPGTAPTTSTARRSLRQAPGAWPRSMPIAILRGSTPAGPKGMRSGIQPHIDARERRQWNALEGTHIPFLRHEFLSALEHTGCIGAHTGWEPRYFTLQDAQGLAAAVPAFVKMHSYGEFVFDFAWAQAYSRFGSRYYPKLTVAVPFTPATGPRLLVRTDLDRQLIARRLLADIEAYTS